MVIVLPYRTRMWLLAVDHAGLAAGAAALSATLVISLCFQVHGVSLPVTAVRAATVFVLTYASCLTLLVLYQRTLVHALAREYREHRAALRAVAEQALKEARGEHASESLRTQQA